MPTCELREQLACAMSMPASLRAKNWWMNVKYWCNAHWHACSLGYKGLRAGWFIGCEQCDKAHTTHTLVTMSRKLSSFIVWTATGNAFFVCP